MCVFHAKVPGGFAEKILGLVVDDASDSHMGRIAWVEVGGGSGVEVAEEHNQVLDQFELVGILLVHVLVGVQGLLHSHGPFERRGNFLVGLDALVEVVGKDWKVRGLVADEEVRDGDEVIPADILAEGHLDIGRKELVHEKGGCSRSPGSRRLPWLSENLVLCDVFGLDSRVRCE